MLRVDQDGLAANAQKEACVLTAYPDTHTLAQGIGINDPTLRAGDTISYEEAIAKYVATVPNYENSINRIFDGVDLQQQHVNAIFSAMWNAGATRIRDEERRLISAIKKFIATPKDDPAYRINRDWAGYELIHLKFDVEHRPFNLTRRCQEVVIFTKGLYGDLSKLPLWREGRAPKGPNAVDPEMVDMPIFREAA